MVDVKDDTPGAGPAGTLQGLPALARPWQENIEDEEFSNVSCIYLAYRSQKV